MKGELAAELDAEERQAEQELLAAVDEDRLAAALPEVFTAAGNSATYLDALGEEDWRANSRAVALAEVINFGTWMCRHVPGVDTHDVQAAHIRDYLTHLRDQKLSATTTRLSLIFLRIYFDFLTGSSKDEPAGNPAREVPLPQRELPVITPYSPAEAEAIFAAIAEAAHAAYAAGDTAGWLLAERDHAMLATLRFAGIRRGELRRLRIRDVDLTHAVLQIKGKGARDRAIRIPRVLVAILARYLTQVRCPDDSGQFVFCELDPLRLEWVYAGSDADHDPRYLTPDLAEAAREEDDDYGLGTETLTRRARFYARAAGIEGHHGAHRWRHTHASDLAQAGIPLDHIATRLGHDLSNRKEKNVGWNPITLYYVSLSQDYLAEVVTTALPNPLAD